MVTKRTGRTVAEAPLPLVKRLLGAADESEVLVGGQALSVWIAKYGLQLPTDLPVITRDTVYLAQSAVATASVEKFARAINGKAIFPRRLDRTALVGQVELEVSNESCINVDVIFQIVGLDPAKVLERAVRVELFGSTTFLVMHPLDLLKSRLANLHELREKQNDKGAAQLRLGMAAAQAYLREQAARYPAAETGAGPQPDPDAGVGNREARDRRCRPQRRRTLAHPRRRRDRPVADPGGAVLDAQVAGSRERASLWSRRPPRPS